MMNSTSGEILNYEAILKTMDELPQDTTTLDEIQNINPCNSLNNDYSIYLNNESDYDTVLKGVMQNGDCLQYANTQFKSDTDIVIEAIKTSSFALAHTTEINRNNKELVLNAIIANPHSFQYASQSLKKDEEVILEAVRQDYINISNLPSDLRSKDYLHPTALKNNKIASNYTKAPVCNISELEHKHNKIYVTAYVGLAGTDKVDCILEDDATVGDLVKYICEKGKLDYIHIAFTNNETVITPMHFSHKLLSFIT